MLIDVGFYDDGNPLPLEVMAVVNGWVMWRRRNTEPTVAKYEALEAHLSKQALQQNVAPDQNSAANLVANC